MIAGIAFAVVLLVAVILTDRQITRIYGTRVDAQVLVRLDALEDAIKKAQKTANSAAVAIGMSTDDRHNNRKDF